MGIFNLLFGGSYSNRARRDQRSFGTSFKNVTSPFNSYGTCFSCEGSGKKTFDCKPCDGTGTHHGTCNLCNGSGLFEIAAKPCNSCQGSDFRYGKTCTRCSGTGEYKPAINVPCKKCSGAGSFSAPCKRCEGSGDFEVTCSKCSGSGWHRF